MRILLLAPHPFYQERGTPIAVDLLVGALAERGDTVDILTYHEGADRAYAGAVAIHRIRRPPLASGIRPGFSLKKLACDAVMLPRALAMAGRHRYGLVHAVEESVFMAMRIRRRRGIPYVFDMDSSMPRQIIERRPFLRPLSRAMAAMERRAIRGACAVVPMCDSLAASAASAGAKRVVTLRDISLLGVLAPRTQPPPPDLPPFDGATLLYLGNLEPYQGVGLLLEGLAAARAARRNVRLLVAGGAPGDVRRYTARARALGVHEAVLFLGPRPVRAMSSLFAAADILVSPRVAGTNTPMKIYSYLDSGKPVVATRLATHTQVLDETVAVLVEPDPRALAEGIGRLVDDPDLRKRLAAAGADRVRSRYSLAVFRRTVRDLYGALEEELKGG
jgi:glycosyltransferase involved in cell wall biosynthesis